MSSIIIGIKHEGNWMAMDHRALRCVKANNDPLNGSSWWVPMVDGMTLKSSSQLQCL
jgi:hypothetical protein